MEPWRSELRTLFAEHPMAAERIFGALDDGTLEMGDLDKCLWGIGTGCHANDAALVERFGPAGPQSLAGYSPLVAFGCAIGDEKNPDWSPIRDECVKWLAEHGEAPEPHGNVRETAVL